jgi:hypothetical protein
MWKPASNVYSSTRPKVVTTPVLPVVTDEKQPNEVNRQAKIIPTKMQIAPCLLKGWTFFVTLFVL